MHTAALPLTRDLVLIGGGHTHALVLRSWGMNPLPGVRVTLINPGPTAPYSGMLPGHVAGHYARDALDIDLVRLARFAGARMVLGAAAGIDLGTRLIDVPGRPPVGFDIASLDIGITSGMPNLPGFEEHAMPAKPLGPFAARWSDYLEADGAAEVAVIGGGVAGVELSLAMAHALRARGRRARISVVDSGKALDALRPPARLRLRAAMREYHVTLYENIEVTAVTDAGLTLGDGRCVPASFVTGAAGARPYDWLSLTGLVLEAGFIKVDPRLRSSDPSVFAVGDCAHLAFDPRPKAGVYAVRQAPVLLHNLRASLAGTGGLRRYRPQRDYLKLISLGAQSALGDRFGMAVSGPWVWRWKDRIDRAFMDKFAAAPPMRQPALPWPRAADVSDVLGHKPICGGCGSKVGRGALEEALADLPPSKRDDVLPLPGDDAALIRLGTARQVISTDHLSAFIEDPVMMARIAAQHALNDIWAMGARPQAATASLILPRLSDSLTRRTLTEVMQTLHSALTDAGAALVGGHTSVGDRLTIGLTVTGLLDRDPITLGGAQPGDRLIVTRPIGTGVLMAADMAGRARGADVAHALLQMSRSNRRAAEILHTATAMTDVTGFGLAGHLLNLCRASGVGAGICLADVPLLPGAERLARAGIRSSLYPQNRAALPDWPDGARADLMLDPQTSGGMLAAVPASSAADILAELIDDGHSAVLIGVITDTPGQITAL